MPHYYFNVYNDDITMDDEGAELADLTAARARAVKEARALAADTVLRGHFVAHHRIDIVDEQRNPVGSVRFDEAVELRQ
tara:strand:- start:2306 stop:2542 length:237 start_codon:yes stop_codon:yes gene_type:complete